MMRLTWVLAVSGLTKAGDLVVGGPVVAGATGQSH